MKAIIIIIISIISISGCKKIEKHFNVATLEIKTNYVAVDSIEYTLYYDRNKMISKRYYVSNEINLAKRKNIDVSKKFWICLLDSIDQKDLISYQYLKFQKECFDTLVTRYPIITNADIFLIFKNLNLNILNCNSLEGKRSIKNFKNHYENKLKHSDIEPCRKKNLEKLFMCLDTVIERPNVGIFFYNYNNNKSSPESTLLSNPFFKLSITTSDNKKNVILEYLFDTNINYSSN